MKKKTNARRRVDPNVYPPGLDYHKVKALAKYYDDRKDEDLIGEAIPPDPDSLPVWVEVPPSLLPQVRKLIERHRRSA